MKDVDSAPVDTLTDAADAIAEDLPEPRQNAIDQATVETAAENTALELDALGVPWNSQIHATGPDGKGVRTKSGGWRKRRGVAGSAPYLDTSSATAPKAAEPTPEETSAKSLEHQSRLAGATCATLLVRFSIAIGGKSFVPRKYEAAGVTIDEQSMLQGAFADYFVAKGVVDVPPGVMLLSALCMYYMPRLQEPEVKSKAQTFAGWIKDRSIDVWYWVKRRRRPRKVSDKSTDVDRTLEPQGVAYGVPS